MSKNIPAQDSAESTQQRECLFLDRMPRELRIRIYEYVIDMHTRIIFHTTWADKELRGEGVEEYLQDFHFSYDYPDSDSPYSDDFPDIDVILGYKFSTFTPLHVVSKQISHEVREEADIINSWLHNIMRSHIGVDDPFCSIADNPFFLELCGRSRLEINVAAEEARDFLIELPEPLRHRIPSIVLGPSILLVDDGGTRRAWEWSRQAEVGEWSDWDNWHDGDGWPRTNGKHSGLVEFLRKEFPGFREIAVWLPRPGTYEVEFYADSAPDEIGQLLWEGIVDVVRFLYRESNPDLLSECSRLKMAISPGKNPSLFGVKLRTAPLVATVEEVLDTETGKPLTQTTESPFNIWPDGKTVIALRRESS